MKQAVGIVLLSLYAFALVRPVMPLVDYYVQLEAYKERCINRAKPSLHCNGQCILMQKLKAANPELQEPLAPAPVKINLEDFPIAVLSKSTTQQLSNGIGTNLKNNYYSTALLALNFVAEVFHPPSTLR